MKLKITRPDGTVIEAEGTVEECERLIGAPIQNPVYWLQPIRLTPVPVPVYPVYPVYPSYPYYGPYIGDVIPDPPWMTTTWTTGTITITEPAFLKS
jgi:hypothetical protein